MCVTGGLTISCPVPPHLVHGLLWHWPDFRREWRCINYLYIQISKDQDVLCMICVGAIWGFPLLQLFWHYFETWNQPPNNLKGCDTHEELAGSKAIPSKPLNYILYHGWCIFLIEYCRYSWDLTPQYISELQQILSACHISHNSPCLHIKRQDKKIKQNGGK